MLFDGSGTTDPDGTISSWSLSFGDGSPPVTGTGPPPSPTAVHSFPQSGDYGATLTVTDSHGVSAVAPFTFVVQPTLALTPSSAPPSGTVAAAGTGFLPNEPVDLEINGQAWGSTTADGTGGFDVASLTVPDLQPGNAVVRAVGRDSGIAVNQTLTVSSNWQFRYSASGGSFNPYENSIDVGNVGALVPAPWQGKAAKAINSSPASVNGLVFAGSNDGLLYEWSSTSYAQLRRLPFTGAVGAIDSSPVNLGGDVYVGSEDGTLYGFPDNCPPATQEMGCSTTLKVATGGPIESSPIGSGTTLYVGSDDGNLYAISTATQAILWSTDLNAPVTSSPALSGSTVVVGAGNDVYGLNASTGAVLWTGTTAGTVSSSPAVAGGTVYVGSQDGKLYAFPLACTATCLPQWTVTTGGPIESSPALAYGNVYVGSDDGKLYAYQLSNQSLLWTLATGGAVKSSPAAANGVVYVGSDDDKLYATSAAGCGGPTTCPPLWTSAPTGGPITSSPAISNGQVYVGSGDGHLYVYVLGSQTVPGAPVIGKATPGNGQATVAFTPPVSNGGSPITSYTVSATDLTHAANGGETASGAGSPIIVTGLTNADSYTFTVRATNGTGSGAASSPTSAVVPFPAPAASSVTPAAIVVGATRPIVLSGNSFMAGTTMKVSGSGLTLTKVKIANSTTIDANAVVTASAASGPRDVTVTDAYGTSTCAHCLTIDALPTIAGATPPAIAAGASGSVVVAGSGFQQGATMKLNSGTTNISGSKLSVAPSGITATVGVPASAPPGAYTVKVTNPDGRSATCAACFSVLAAPTLTGMSQPTAVPGTVVSVSLTGTGFGPGATLSGPTGVSFSQVTVENATTVTATIRVAATAPAGTNLAVKLTNNAASGYGKATGKLLTIT